MSFHKTLQVWFSLFLHCHHFHCPNLLSVLFIWLKIGMNLTDFAAVIAGKIQVRRERRTGQLCGIRRAGSNNFVTYIQVGRK